MSESQASAPCSRNREHPTSIYAAWRADLLPISVLAQLWGCAQEPRGSISVPATGHWQTRVTRRRQRAWKATGRQNGPGKKNQVPTGPGRRARSSDWPESPGPCEWTTTLLEGWAPSVVCSSTDNVFQQHTCSGVCLSYLVRRLPGIPSASIARFSVASRFRGRAAACRGAGGATS